MAINYARQFNRRIGNQLFICELKANRFSCEPLQHQNYRLKLDEATEQVIRKVNFVRGNLDLFLAEAGIVSCIPPDSVGLRILSRREHRCRSGHHRPGCGGSTPPSRRVRVASIEAMQRTLNPPMPRAA